MNILISECSVYIRLGYDAFELISAISAGPPFALQMRFLLACSGFDAALNGMLSARLVHLFINFP